MVIGVSSFQNMAETMADVLKRLSGDTKILNKLCRTECRNNGIPPVARSRICPLGMGDTSYFIFDPIPIFSSPVSSISIPIPVN